ncbi:MAG: FliA/WhiG family RNA polymerase sigma factor [Candidatus Brocadiales bacterium]
MKNTAIQKKKYKKEVDWKVRNKLILDYLPLVKYVVGKVLIYIPPQVEHEDLVEYGIIGLIDAAEKYDDTKETKFGTYAITRIRGTILDHLRSQDWVPRSVREKAAVVKRVYAGLEQKLNRPPRPEEIADALKLNLPEWNKLLSEITLNSFISIEEFKDKIEGYEGVCGADLVKDQKTKEPLFNVEEMEEKELLANAITELPQRERLVISLYYYEDLLLKEISEVMGISESRVSQLHHRALFLLRSKISKISAFANFQC